MCFPRSVHSQRRLVARGGLDAWSDPKDPLVPSDPFPPLVCGAGPLRSGIYDGGAFGCGEVGRMAERQPVRISQARMNPTTRPTRNPSGPVMKMPSIGP